MKERAEVANRAGTRNFLNIFILFEPKLLGKIGNKKFNDFNKSNNLKERI